MNIQPKAIKSFECELYSLEKADKQIKLKFEPVIIVRNIRQTCRIKIPKLNENKSNTNSNAYRIKKLDPMNKILNKLDDDEELDEEINLNSNQNLNNNSYLNGKNTNNKFRSSPSSSTLNSSNYYLYSNSNNNNLKLSELNKRDAFTLKEGEKVTIKFEFRNFPEFVEIGDTVIINEPFMKAYGCISSLDT